MATKAPQILLKDLTMPASVHFVPQLHQPHLTLMLCSWLTTEICALTV